MDNLDKIVREIQTLSPPELEAFRRWFWEFDAGVWDRQIEEDIQAGRLDGMADAALKAFAAGKCREI